MHLSGTTRPNFTKFYVRTCCPWLSCGGLSLCLHFRFVDDFMFSYNDLYGGMRLLQQPRGNIVHGLTPLLCIIACIILSYTTAIAKTRRARCARGAEGGLCDSVPEYAYFAFFQISKKNDFLRFLRCCCTRFLEHCYAMHHCLVSNATRICYFFVCYFTGWDITRLCSMDTRYIFVSGKR